MIIVVFHLKDINECEDLSRCAENATCTNMDGSYDCNCSAAESHLCFGTYMYKPTKKDAETLNGWLEDATPFQSLLRNYLVMIINASYLLLFFLSTNRCEEQIVNFICVTFLM